jgi:hypothetical protein
MIDGNKKIQEIEAQLFLCKLELNSNYGLSKITHIETYNLINKLKREKKLLLINLDRKNKLDFLANKKSED